MAVEYSLLTWAGLGTTVTFTDAGDIVNFTSHGAPNGHAFRFTTTGSLPTGLTAGTTYYLRAGADANKFLIYPTQADAIAGTNQVTFSGTGSGTNKVVGEYWSALPDTDPGNGGNYRARYGTAGSERVYSGFKALSDAVSGFKTADMALVCEIQGKWTDFSALAYNTATQGLYSLTITTMINGFRGDGYHGGVIGGGYVRYINGNTASIPTNPRDVVDGIECQNASTGTAASGITIGTGMVVKNCICSRAYNGFNCSATAFDIHNCIAINCSNAGYQFNTTSGSASIAYNNLAVKNTYGFSTSISATLQGAILNNVAVGNTTSNWFNAPTAGYWVGLNNAGASGDSPWGTGAITTATADNATFVDYANNDFRHAGDSAAHTATSTLVDAGNEFFGLDTTCITNSIVTNGDLAPAYKNGATLLRDIGPFEFDWGYGLAPTTVNISITGMAFGSEIAIYKASDMSEILAPQSTTGSYSGTYTYTGDTNIIVRVRKGTSATRYLPYEYAGTITSTGFQLVVSQIPDTIAQ